MVISADEEITRLAGRKPLDVRYVVLDHESTAPFQMCGGVGKGSHLLVLGGEVGDRVAEQVYEAEAPIDSRTVAKSTDGHLYLGAALSA